MQASGRSASYGSRFGTAGCLTGRGHCEITTRCELHHFPGWHALGNTLSLAADQGPPCLRRQPCHLLAADLICIDISLTFIGLSVEGVAILHTATKRKQQKGHILMCNHSCTWMFLSSSCCCLHRTRWVWGIFFFLFSQLLAATCVLINPSSALNKFYLLCTSPFFLPNLSHVVLFPTVPVVCFIDSLPWACCYSIVFWKNLLVFHQIFLQPQRSFCMFGGDWKTPIKYKNSLGLLLSLCVCIFGRVLVFVFDLALFVCMCISVGDADEDDGKETRAWKTTAWSVRANRTGLSL